MMPSVPSVVTSAVPTVMSPVPVVVVNNAPGKGCGGRHQRSRDKQTLEEGLACLIGNRRDSNGITPVRGVERRIVLSVWHRIFVFCRKIVIPVFEKKKCSAAKIFSLLENVFARIGIFGGFFVANFLRESVFGCAIDDDCFLRESRAGVFAGTTTNANCLVNFWFRKL